MKQKVVENVSTGIPDNRNGARFHFGSTRDRKPYSLILGFSTQMTRPQPQPQRSNPRPHRGTHERHRMLAVRAALTLTGAVYDEVLHSNINKKKIQRTGEI